MDEGGHDVIIYVAIDLHTSAETFRECGDCLELVLVFCLFY